MKIVPTPIPLQEFAEINKLDPITALALEHYVKEGLCTKEIWELKLAELEKMATASKEQEQNFLQYLRVRK